MDPVLSEIYKTVFGAAPYVIAAYALLWLGLVGYIALGIRRVSKLEQQLELVEEAAARRSV